MGHKKKEGAEPPYLLWEVFGDVPKLSGHLRRGRFIIDIHVYQRWIGPFATGLGDCNESIDGLCFSEHRAVQLLPQPLLDPPSQIKTVGTGATTWESVTSESTVSNTCRDIVFMAPVKHLHE